MYRYSISREYNSEESTIAEGIVFSDGVTLLRWTDGSSAFGLYPGIDVLAGINSPDGKITLHWLDGEPQITADNNHSHNYEHVHNNGHAHSH